MKMAIYRPKNRVNGKPKTDNPYYGHIVTCFIGKGSFGEVIDNKSGDLIYAWLDELEFKESD